MAKETPPVDNKASRFGNPAFKTFYDKVNNVSSRFFRPVSRTKATQASRSLHSENLVSLGLPEESIKEISVYFNESWGNKTRIDYGSGMELNFLCWLYVCGILCCFNTDVRSRFCLEKLGVLQETDHTAIVVKVFWRSV